MHGTRLLLGTSNARSNSVMEFSRFGIPFLASDELVTLADVRLLTRLTLLAYNGVILVHLLSSFVLLLVWVRWREDASVCSSLDSW